MDTIEFAVAPNFEQPFRAPGRGPGPWSYGGFGPFVFDRAQYEAALERARAAWERRSIEER